MRIGNIVIFILGAFGVLLGGLWLVQGLGLVTIQPILCVADCETLEGPAPLWAVIGVIVLAAGGYAILHAIRRWRRDSHQARGAAGRVVE